MMSATEYSIGVVKNRFALNGIEEEEIDPLELLKRRELETEAKKKSKTYEKVTKTKDSSKNKPNKIIKESNKGEIITHKDKDVKPKQKDTEVTKKHVTIVENNNRHYFDNASDFHQYDDDFGEKDKKDYHASSAFEGESLERGRGARRGLPRGVFVRGGGTRGGGWKGPQRATTFDVRGKREFDRQSGSDKTGIKSVDKRDGSGAHNWGNPRDDIETLKTPYSADDSWNSEKIGEEPPLETNETNDEEEVINNTVTNLEEEEEEEKKELTLDEWKALKTPRKQPTYNIRKAGEGEDLSQWKKMYALEKKKDDEGEEYEEYELGEYPQRVGRQKILEIDIRFKDTRNIGSGRGRGIGRGSGAALQSGRRSSSPFQSTTANNRTLIDIPKVYDERDFPSLA